MARAAEVVALEGKFLLHAGPPANPPHALVQPTLNSAAVAAVFEGWASNLDESLALVSSGEVRFEPAQDHGVFTPMAAVVSPSMRLVEMTDAGDSGASAYSPINGGGTGGGAGPRYGRRTQANLDLIRFLNGPVANRLVEASSDEPIAWLDIIDGALCGGDDAHLHHVAAHARLLELLAGRLQQGFGDSEADAFMAESPFFHLNFAMAAIGCAVNAGRGIDGASVITAFGGNGAEFGLQVSGLPGRWFTCKATPPRGKLREPHGTDDCVGAYGDSAIVEAFGLGALAHRYCPRMRELHHDFYEPDLLGLPSKLLITIHKGLPRSGARVALSARRVVACGATPVVELGIVERTGNAGGLGAGLYRPPMAPFASVCRALDELNAEPSAMPNLPG